MRIHKSLLLLSSSSLSLLLGSFLDDTDGNGLLHVSDGESSEWWELVESLDDHWLRWDHLDDSGILGFDGFWELFSDLTGSLVHLVLDLSELASNMASVAIKDWCNDPMLHEKHIRKFQSRQRPVNVLTTHSSWLMASLSMGPAGLLSGAGSVIADLQVALFEAIQADDLVTARAANDQIYPLAQAFYRAPFLDMHNRMKVCLQLLGRIDAAVVRPPLMPLTSGEIEELKVALVASGLLPDA